MLGCCLALSSGCNASDSNDEQAGPSARAKASGVCDRFASARARGGGNGTRTRPFRTFAQLVRSLGRGAVGCLAAGRYEHRGVVELQQPGITIRPLGRARGRVVIDGAVWVMPRARGARIARLSLVSHDPVFTIPLKIQADDVTVIANDITTSTSISCVLIGSSRTVTGTVIERNRITRCGRQGKHDHLIYVQKSRDAVIRNNLLTDNAGGWAVHLYPDADGTLIEHNVIDGNQGGVIFAGARGETSDGNVVRENVITSSSPRYNIESSWSGGPFGSGNAAFDNCVFSSGLGAPSGVADEEGFEESNNRLATADLYVNHDAGDFRLRPGTACAPVLRAAAGLPLLPRR
jgi:nitrous oxidase accessory protein NosD